MPPSRVCLSFTFAFLFATCALFAADEEWWIVPGERVGPITAGMDAQDIAQAVGASNVRGESLEIGEGMKRPATVVFFDDPERRAEIFWIDDRMECIESIRIEEARTRWRTPEGITVGTPLSSLVELNGRPLTLTGFGWDYGGTLLDFRGGRLAALGRIAGGERQERTLLLRVSPDMSGARESPDYAAVLGDRDFSSSHPAMIRLDPRVYSLSVFFPRPGSEPIRKPLANPGPRG